MFKRVFKKPKHYIEGTSTIHQIGLSCNPLPPTGYGGIETVITNLTRGLVREGVPVICYSPPPFDIEGAGHYPTLPKSTPGPKQGVSVANTKEHLERVLEGLKQNWRRGDIIHLHHSEQYPVLKRFKKGWFEKTMFVETADWMWVSLEKNIAYPCKALKSTIGKKGSVIPHGIDFSVFSEKWQPGNYLFYAGRVTRDKGVHIGVEAAKEYGIEFRIAGPLVDKEYAESFMGDVNYIGELKADELAKQYGESLALLYMTQYVEPFGLSVVEAMACGAPVITTGNGGTGETVLDGKTGFFCQSKKDILKALDKIGNINRDDCIERAREYSIERMAKGYMEFYKKPNA